MFTIAYLTALGVRINHCVQRHSKLRDVKLTAAPSDVGFSTADDQVKGEWLQQRGKPDLVIEDRARVVHMWRKLGVNCLQIAEGEF